MTAAKPSCGQAQHAARLCALRAALKNAGLAGFIVPKADAFQNEQVPAHFDRLGWLTGFTGTAGTAFVFADRALIIVDGRYTLQAKAEVDAALFTVEQWPQMTPAKAIEQFTKPGERLGFDPLLHPKRAFEPLKEAAETVGASLVPCAQNPIDALWREGREPERYFPVMLHSVTYAGESAADKLARVQAAIKEKRGNGAFIAAPDSVAWLFNLRGRDVRHTPVALMRAYVPAEGRPMLFAQPAHLGEDHRAELLALADWVTMDRMDEALLGAVAKGARILVDGGTPIHFWELFTKAGAKPIEAADPCKLLKAKKNAVELEGARRAHLRDGAALSRFLHWLDVTLPAGTVDELSAAAKLEAFRRQSGALEDLSFDTISAAGPNAAIVHYQPSPATNAKLTAPTLYLVDSGGQYLDGTTDVTRTVAVGEPTAEMRTAFTLVLKGNINLSLMRFPKGTRGCDLDVIARAALWRHGLDYSHGTGHGVGSYLSVHEGPQAVSKYGTAVLEPGMILSNEPGYYREGHFGIRIENLMVVRGPEPVPGGEEPMMSFEVLTLAPIDRRLIDVHLLNAEERAWLSAYHDRVAKEIGPLLDEKERAWLTEATRPL